MKRHVLPALLLIAAFSPAFAQIQSPTYDRVQDMASGQTTAGAAYDGSTAKGAVAQQVSGALATGGLAAQPDAKATLAKADLTASVPSPEPKKKDEGFFSKIFNGTALAMGGGALVGALIGLHFGGPIGALLGAAIGAFVGFGLSKLLKK